MTSTLSTSRGRAAGRAAASRDALAGSHQPSAHGPSAEITRVGWTPLLDIGLEEWSAVGRRFGEIGRCSQWWLGDWINYGNAKFGERYSRAVKLTGYDVQSLMNMVYVASRFDISRRREKLSWSHHAALASLDLDAQERWLDRAIAERLSVADLRVEARSARRAMQAAGEGSSREDAAFGADGAHARDGGGAPGGAVHENSTEPLSAPARAIAVVCPNCGEVVPLEH